MIKDYQSVIIGGNRVAMVKGDLYYGVTFTNSRGQQKGLVCLNYEHAEMIYTRTVKAMLTGLMPYSEEGSA